jgi:DNA-directed RNA polymerase subunit RPC12/RpoP
MNVPSKRPTLSLRGLPTRAVIRKWRCKPCGAAVEVDASLANEERVRCPSCNASLGVAAAFRAGVPGSVQLRARVLEETAAPVVIKRRA